ncbi:MAG TPA: DUF2339 domain-containing protein [Bryobacteraceae bacterium]|nr:DUF2339 domain-containing protein [Bryobacteraceae bacterium]
MPNPDQERMDVLSSAIARLIGQQEQFDKRLARIEAALSLQPIHPETRPAPPLPPPPVRPVAEAAPPPIAAPPAHEPEPPAPEAPPPLPETASPPRSLETNIGLTWINRIGAVTLVLGIAFLFKWAVDNQYIGPAGRVILGIIAGLAAIAAADLLWNKGQRIFAQGVTATGLGVLYLSVYAAFGYYHLIPQPLAFVFMVATTALAAALALRYESVAMAVLGLIGGYLTPIMLSTGEDHPWFLFNYVLLLNIGAMALVRIKKWQLLELESFAATAILYGAWFADRFNSEKQFVATFFILIYYALFSQVSVQPLFLVAQVLATLTIGEIWPKDPGVYLFLTLLLAAGGLAIADTRRIKAAASVTFATFWAVYGVWVSQLAAPRPIGTIFLGTTCAFLLFFAWIPWRILVRRENARTEELIILALNGAAYFGASYALLNTDYHAWMGLFAVAVAGVHLALGIWMWRRQAAEVPDQRPILLAIGVSLSLLILAAPIQFTQYRITMAWSLEFLALSWIALRAKSTRLGYAAILISALVWVRLIGIDSWLYSYADTTYTLLWNARFLTFAVAAICAWLAAYLNKPNPSALLHYLSGHVILLWGLSLEDIAWASRISLPENLLSFQTVSISILFAVYAVILIVAGVGTRTAVNRISGLVLIGFVVLKLYLFDVWQLGRGYRISAFVALGALLLTTSFLYSHFRALIESWWKDDQTPS